MIKSYLIDWIDRLRGRIRGSSTLPNGADLLRQREVVAAEFDAAFYAACYPQVGGGLLDHFMTEGWRAGHDPTPYFSTSSYLDSYPDVVDAGVNPFYHYIEHGRSEGRVALPIWDEEHSWEIEAIRRGLEVDFYAEQLRKVKIDPKGVDLALHYWRDGVRMGFDPALYFSTAYYLAAHADVASEGVNPFAHFMSQGRKEGRSIQRVTASAAASLDPDGETKMKDAFDAEFYLLAYPDVAAAAVDPLAHFITSGWKEGRNPNAWFSVNDYLEFYPDVASAKINPLVHYLSTGQSEGRIPRHELGFRYDIIKSLQPLEMRVAEARKWTSARKLAPAKALRDALGRATRLETQGIYISVSHDDFTANFGGVQLVLMRESAAVDEMGLDHLHLFPASSIPIAELESRDPVLGVLFNRKRVGFFRSSEIEQELRTIAQRLRIRPFAIHSLIRHNAKALISILKAAGCSAGWYWIHDYSSVCTGYTLLRNDVEFCGGPPPTSTGCSLCVYGGLRVRQIKAHELLFRELDLTVLAPSDTALSVWKASTSVSAPTQVHQHLQFAMTDEAEVTVERRSVQRPLRVAYVGQAVSHKGWLAFRDLALQFRQDPRYEFYHVGKDPQPGVPVTFKEVAVGPEDLDKMVRVLRELEIDVAILWSLWPETFCLAAAEALRAGAALLTFKDSGNIAAMVRKTGIGAVLDNEELLQQLFETGEVVGLAATARATGLTARFSNMTADFIEGMVA